MATTIWKGGAGDFAEGSQWSTGAVPGAGDVAVIDSTSGSANVLLSGGQQLAGLTLDDPQGTLTLAGDLFLNLGTFDALAGTLALSGTLEGGTLALGGASLVISDLSPVDGSVVTPVLRNLTVTGSLDLGDGVTLAVEGLRTGSLQNLRIGAGSTLVLLGAEQFTGLAIDLAGGTITEDETDTNTGQLMIDYGTVVTQDAAGTTARIGPSVNLAIAGLGAVTNYGTIVAKAGTLALDAEGGSFTSPSHIGPFTNRGTIEIDAGATVILNTVATLAGLGTIVSHGGLLDLKGALDLTGAALDVGAANAFQNLRLDGTITGGAIVESGGALAVGTASLIGVAVSGSGFVFDALTLGAGTTFSPSGGAFVLTASDAAFGQIELQDGADLANVQIAYGGAQYRVGILATGGPTATATLDASAVINVGKGQVLVLDAGNGALVNNAVINVAAGGRLEFDNAGSYVAGGTLNLAAGATVVLNGTIGLNALANIVGSGANLINTGVLDLKGGSISTAGDAHFSSFVNEGTVTNGTVVTVAGQNPNLGTIGSGGTLTTGAGVLPVNAVTLDDATVKGDVRLLVNGVFALTGDTKLSNADGTGPGSVVLNEQPGVFVLGSATSLQFNASATLSNANLLLSGITTADLGAAFTAQPDINVQFGSTATFAADTTIIATTVNGPISGIGNQGFVVNKGHIVVTAGADFFIVPYGSTTAQDFVNEGAIDIAAGGVLDVATNVSIAALGAIHGAGGLLRLDKNNVGNTAYDNAGNTIHVGGGSAPDLELDGATISGGAIENDGGIFSSINFGTLDNVTYTGALHVGSAKDIYGATQPGSLAFKGGALNSQSVTVDSGAQLLLDFDQTFNGATITLAGELADTGHTLSFDAATTVSITGSVYLAAQHILNAGTITVGPGGSLSLADFGAYATPEPSTAGVIAVNGGTFQSGVLNAGQTLEFGPLANVSIGRYDPGSIVDFKAPNTLTLAKGTSFGAEVHDFGVGDAIDLSGYLDFNPTGVSVSYDGDTVTVSANGAVLEAIKVGAGYDPNGFQVTQKPLPGVFATDYVLTYLAPGQPAPTPPGIAGTLANQAITDVQTATPFVGVTLSEATAGAILTIIVTQSGGGVLSAPGGGAFDPSGTVWSDTGSRAAVQAALAALTFTPTAHAVAPGQTETTSFTLSVSDPTGTATDNTTSVVATAVEDPLLVSGATPFVYVSDTDNNAQPFDQIVLSDPDNAAYSATATLSGATGTSFAHSYAATIDSNGVFHTSGTLATVQQALRDLVVYTAAHQVPTGQSTQAVVTYSISNGVSQTVGGASTIDIAATGVPSAAGMYIVGGGPGQTVADTDTINPFSVVAVVDPSKGQIDTVTVTLSDPANGTLSDPLGGVFSNGVFTYTAATPDDGQFAEDIDKVLVALVFAPTLHQAPLGKTVTTGFTVTVSNSLGSTTDASTSVIATSSTGVLAIAGTQANQEFSDATTALPLSGVTLSDTNAGATETATVTLSNPAAGALSSGAGGAVGSDGIFRVSGSLAAVQAALRGLKFLPAAAALGQMSATGLTVTLSDGVANARDDGASLIVVGASASVSPPAPTVTISPVGVINHATASTPGGIALSGAVSGLAAGGTFQISVSDGAFAQTYTATVDASGAAWRATIPQADAIRLPDGTAVISSTVTNDHGHGSASVNVTVAETLPIVTISPVGNGNVIDNAVASAAGGIALTGTVAGLAAGATFEVKVTDGAFVKTYTAKVNSTGSRWSATLPSADASALSNGIAIVSAQATDAYGTASATATDAVLVNLSGTAVGDVHMVTYDGLHYDFQADGTFVLTRSTTPGDPFQIQIQTSPFPQNHAASMTTQVAAQLGADVLLFDTGAKTFLSVDGVADTTLGARDATQVFAGGKLVAVSPTEYRVEWNSGETLTLKDNGYYIDTSVALGPHNGPGSVQGLLGPDEGQANDFQLPDGRVLAQPLTEAQIMGPFAQAWSVTPADTLFGGGSTPLGFAAGSAGHEVIEAGAPGDVLSARSGGEILSDAGGFGASFRGSLSALSGDLIAGFSSKDVIDISDFDAAHATLSYAGSSAMGVLTLSDGRQTGELYLAGTLSGGSFHAASDALGGARITFG